MRTALALIVLLSCAPLGAHDFWIEPTTFRPAAGERIGVALRVGEDFDGQPVPRSSEHIAAFVVRDGSGERAVAGFERRDPAGFVAAGESTAVIAYRSNASSVELPRAKFESYLREEGAHGLTVQHDGTQRERFFRFAKSIVGEGSVSAPLGLRYEIVPSEDLSRFQVLFDGKPLADALVVALSRDGKHFEARTDGRGFVVLPISGGVWLIKSTRIAAAPKESGFDWESLWASLTFELTPHAAPLRRAAIP